MYLYATSPRSYSCLLLFPLFLFSPFSLLLFSYFSLSFFAFYSPNSKVQTGWASLQGLAESLQEQQWEHSSEDMSPVTAAFNGAKCRIWNFTTSPMYFANQISIMLLSVISIVLRYSQTGRICLDVQPSAINIPGCVYFLRFAINTIVWFECCTVSSFRSGQSMSPARLYALFLVTSFSQISNVRLEPFSSRTTMDDRNKCFLGLCSQQLFSCLVLGR